MPHRSLAHVFDLARLNAFIATVEEGSITAASRRLSIAQPALSAQIRRLEEDLGQPLFVRQPRGVRLTEAGQTLLPYAYTVFSALRDADTALARLDDEPVGRVALGLPPSASSVLIETLLPSLSATFPQISVRVVEALSGYLQDWIQSGEIDLAITFSEAPSPDIQCDKVFEEEVMLIARHDLMQALPDPVPLPLLADLQLIVTSQRHQLRLELERRIRSFGHDLAIRFEIDAGHQLVRLVRSGEGYGIFAQSAFSVELREGRVKAHRLEPRYRRPVYIVTHQRRASERPVQAVRTHLRAAMHELVTSGDWLGTMQELG